MRAIDTNIIVRYLTGDEPEQAARARTAVDAGNVYVGTTVLLESEWVLRGVYGFTGEEVAAALQAFSGLPGVSLENPTLLIDALELAAKGMDFADALHLGAAARCQTMLTFDPRFIEADRNTPARVMEP